MIKLLLNPWFLLSAVAILVSSTAAAYFIGHAHGEANVKIEEFEQEDQATQNRTEIETRIIRMPKNEVQKLLETKWCRDC